MENVDTRGGFEKFLRESTDQFRMVPSRRVWYSIYNNMHPDRKWPSIAVCLLILTAIMYLGVGNNNHLSDQARNHNKRMVELARAERAEKILSASRNEKEETGTATATRQIFASIVAAPVQDSVETTFDFTSLSQNVVISAPEEITAISASERNRRRAAVQSQYAMVVIDSDVSEEDKAIAETGSEIPVAELLAAKTAESQKIDAVGTDRELLAKVEDIAFRNKPTPKVKKIAGLGYYITPSFGYRSYEKNLLSKSGVIASPNLKDDAALNLEAGVVLRYAADQNVILKAGAQLNYTNYVSKANYLAQPVRTNVAADANRMATASFAVGEGISRLNKSTLQVSVPAGVDFRIAGRGRVKWYAGTSLQPTYVISGNAYVLSTDAKHFVSETDLLRRFNLNASAETFLSFKPSNGIGFSVGPQFRYQLLSTYKKTYNYSERLYNVGVKIGITTGL